MSITRLNEFQASQGKAEELFAFLKSLMLYISSSEGCEGCEVLQNNDDDHLFAVIEKWATVDAHKQCLDNYPKEQMAAAMPLIGAAPKGSFYHA